MWHTILNKIVKKHHYELIMCKHKLERKKKVGYSDICGKNVPEGTKNTNGQRKECYWYVTRTMEAWVSGREWVKR